VFEMMKDKNDSNSNNDENNRLSLGQRIKVKVLMFFLRVFGGHKEYKDFSKRIEAAKDMTPSQGAESFGLYGLPDFKYDVVYSQLKIKKEYKYIWLDSVNGGVAYEGGGFIYIHNHFKGTIYAPNACIYIRKSVYGLIEAENSKILVRGNNAGYVHCPKGEVQIGGSNYGYIYVRNGVFVVLGEDAGITKGGIKELTRNQKKLLKGIKD
jgi:hypothetical protein